MGQLRTMLYMAFNFVSATAIVFVNKLVFKKYGFAFGTVMTALHFLTTWAGVLLCGAAGLYAPKPLRHADVLPITASFCAFVVFQNLSLQHNSIGFYQLTKILTTPVVVFLQLVFYGVRLPLPLVLALVPVCIGVALASVSDVSLNAVGSFWAVAGLLATAFYQLLVKTRQNALGVDSFQLLHYQAPQAAGLVALSSPLFDDVFGASTGLLAFEMTAPVAGAVALSCLLAFCVNLSTFLVISDTNPVTYQVLGHFKLLVILLFGVLFFGEDTNLFRLAGMALAFVGIVACVFPGGHFPRRRRRRSRHLPLHLPPPSGTELGP